MELLEQHFDAAFAAPDGIKKLRELILTLAIQGKLVPQDPNDPPASQLLQEIDAEKKWLVNEGRIKARTLLPEIKSQEMPYALPQGWEWTQLYKLAPLSIIDGDWIETKDQDPSGDIRLIQLADVGVNEFKDVSDRFINSKVFNRLKCTELVQGDILIARLPNPIGRACIFPPLSKRAITAVDIAILRPLNCLDAQYLVHAINSPFFRLQVECYGKGATRFRIATGNLKTFLVPIPPLPEQHRIVAKIDQLMARCDELEKLCAEREQKRRNVHAAALRQLLDAQTSDSFANAWQFITQNFGELYAVKENVAELRKAILQLGIMGKLVPQNPNDPPAGQLLKEIEAEKKKLVKEGKIKAPKPPLAIKQEDVPYRLPNGWEWVRFFVVNIVRSELVSAKYFPSENQIAPDSIGKGDGRLLVHRTVIQSGAIGPNNRFYEGQILYSKIRPSLNKVVIAPYNGLCSADMYPIETYVNSEYMLQTMLSEVFVAQVRLVENRIKMPKLNLESLGQFIIPLPPLSEQRRIVSKTNQLMALCAKLEQQINAAAGKQTELLNAVMAQV